jgi:endonuclease YncB( thermonuclease family)
VALSVLSGQILADTIEGRVVGVSDGDTITVLDSTKKQHKIRLQGIDAPEAKQAFGQASKQHLSNLVFNRQVVAECGKIDRYKRQVCVVMVNGQDANLAQVRAGIAWWYRAYANEQIPEHRAQYQAAEMDARKQRIGLWRDADPVPPWKWRRLSREN